MRQRQVIGLFWPISMSILADMILSWYPVSGRYILPGVFPTDVKADIRMPLKKYLFHTGLPDRDPVHPLALLLRNASPSVAT
jgi:hypothetical protein